MVDLAYAAAQAPGGGAGSVVTQLVFFAAIFAIFYFLLIRPQQKQKREREDMLRAVKRGDRVVTSSGLHGTVASLDDETVTVRVTEQVRLVFDRSAIGRIVSPTGSKDSA
jgi:preprotein translocase subunit YajC